MDKIQVKLLHYTPLEVAINAIRQCWDSHSKSDNMGENDLKLLDRICNQHKHTSTIEHITYNFDIDGISRCCLQELARHRIASYSVKSTRYTLKELKNADIDKDYQNYIVTIDDDRINEHNIKTLKEMQSIIKEGISLDTLKYMLPECYRVRLSWSVNARALNNFLKLRLSKSAHFEIRFLANLIYNALPAEHRVMFKNLEVE